MAHTVTDECLFTRAVDAHAFPVHLRRAPRAQRLIERILLVAKASADVGLDDADIRPRTPERLTDDAADDVRDLRGGHDDDAAIFLVSVAAVVFNVAVLHGGGVVPALDFDEAGLFDRLLIIALADIGVLQDIPREIFVDEGASGSMAFCTSSTNGSSSYSTFSARTPCMAETSSSAMTTATSSP